MGPTPDDPESLGEVGEVRCQRGGSLDDMPWLLAGIPLAEVTTSMTINAPANILWGMYLLAGTANRVPFARLGGTTQNDILKEYIAQKEFLYPPRHALRLVTDTIEFATRATPKWNPVSISGYHIREAGSTAVQELAFTLADGRTYVAEANSAASTSTSSRRGSRSSSTRTTTSSRRSRSSAPPAGSGRR